MRAAGKTEFAISTRAARSPRRRHVSIMRPTTRVSRMPYELDTLQMALLSVCRDTREPIHTLHAHAEDWLARPLDTEEIEAAIGTLANAGLITAYRREAADWVAVRPDSAGGSAELRFLATPAGAEAAAAAWQRFFSE